MRFSFLSVLSVLATFAAVNALPTEPAPDACCYAGGVKVCGVRCPSKRNVPSEDITGPTADGCCKAGGVKVCGPVCRRSEVPAEALQ